MKRRSFLGLAAMSIVANACGAPPVRRREPVATAPPQVAPTEAAAVASVASTPLPVTTGVAGTSDRLWLRDASTGPARLVAISSESGQILSSLPQGFPTTDLARWVSLTPSGGDTELRITALKDGRSVRTLHVPGKFSDGASSYDDRWLLLMQPPAGHEPSPHTPMVIVDVEHGTILDQADLQGRYLPDTVGRGAGAIYLIEQHPERKRDAYAVTLYDRGTHAVAGPIADKRSATTVMSGSKVKHVWSTSGDFLYSLYLDPDGEGAFVHALNVAERFAVCIDLPGKGQPEQVLRQYALAGSPSSTMVYAVNPALELINFWGDGDFDAKTTHLDLTGTAGAGTSTLHSTSSYEAATGPYNHAVVTPDGKTLYIGSSAGILAIDPRRMALAKPTPELLLAGMPVMSLALAPAGKVLYALVGGAQHRLVAVDLATGTSMGEVTVSVARPTGIEHVV